jgi:hypothetical protein
MEQHIKTANLVKSRSIDETHYADLWIIDGKEITFLMHKIEQPNVFGVLKQEDGDSFDIITMDPIE